jgi:hypothetical protein
VAGENSRSNFLFGLTLTELAFILFFILLFFSTLVIKEKVKDIDKFKEEVEVYQKIFEEIPGFNDKTIEEKSKWLKELVEKDKLNIKYQELMEKHKALNDSYKKIVQAIPSLKDKTEAEKAKWLKELVEKSNLDAKNKALGKELDKIKKKLEKLKKVMKLKNEKVASLEKKIKGLTGNRHPDCWQDKKTKKPEFIYNIILGERGITTHRGYKKYLEKEFQEIPGANNIIGTKDLSIRAFKQKTKSVFNWSVKTAKPECRHFVRIFDETKSKEPYKIPLRGIEHYFYKKEYRMTYSEFKMNLASPSNSVIRDTKNKTSISSSKRSSQQFSKKDCISGDRKSMPRQWRKLCEGLERDGVLMRKSKSKPDHSSKENGKRSSLMNELNKIEQIGKTLQSP